MDTDFAGAPVACALDPLSPPPQPRLFLKDDPKAIEAIVALLAQGIELIFARVANGQAIVRQNVNVPQPMQDAQSYIGRLYLEEGKCEGISADLHGLIAQCTLPLCAPEWGLYAFSRVECRFRDTVLVDPDLLVPTPECSVIAKSYRAFGEDQIVEKILFETLQTLAKQSRDSATAYSCLRELLGRHSLISQTRLISYLDEHGLLGIQNEVIHQFYESVPKAWLVDGMAHCCPHCGTLMKSRRRGMAPACTMVQCATIANPAPPILMDADQERHYIAKRTILKYWTEPAIDELRIYDAARHLGIRNATLYPFFDAVDISLLPGTAVGIDVKSYSSPEVLAMKFQQDGIGRLAQYDKKIVAITDACIFGAPDYIERLQDCLVSGSSNPASDVDFIAVHDLVAQLVSFKQEG